jgi:hypothetical protein
VRAARHPIPDDDPLFDLYLDASDRLFETAPTIMGGALALLDYLIDEERCGIIDGWWV